MQIQEPFFAPSAFSTCSILKPGSVSRNSSTFSMLDAKLFGNAYRRITKGFVSRRNRKLIVFDSVRYNGGDIRRIVAKNRHG
jgi:hypothetical protein